MAKQFKGWIITGLLVFIPFWATAFVVYKAFGILDGWIKYFGVHIMGAGIAVLFGVILGLGILTKNYVGRKLHQMVEWIMLKVPLINNLYATFKEVSKTIFNNDKSAFQSVVALEFCGHKTIGFVTGDVPEKIGDAVNPHADRSDYKMVYVMQAFSPAAGFIMMVPASKLVTVDMSIEAAMKLVLTGGMVKSDALAPVVAEGVLNSECGEAAYRVRVTEMLKNGSKGL